MKHKNADIICAWVNGATVGCYSISTDEWIEAPDATKLGEGENFLLPHPIHPEYEYNEWIIKTPTTKTEIFN